MSLNKGFKLSILSISIGQALMACSLSARAVDFEYGELEGGFDSTLSVGSSWSTTDPDSDLYGPSGDDGRRNFKSGDAFSTLFKGIHDLELRYRDTGVFLRGNYWYDFELKDGSQRFKDVSDDNRKRQAQASGYALLDAFIYHNYEIGELPGSVRFGKQVLNWGESTFIGGGLNATNPIDAAAFRRPGAEIKEGLLPVNMISLQQNLTENLSAQAFYQLEWDQTILDNCGTFFAVNDIIPDGCGGLPAGNPDIAQNPAAVAALTPFGINLTSEGVEVQRGPDNDARDSGQFGLALKWYLPELDGELGTYFLNYHSRLPFMSTVAGPNLTDTAFAPQLCGNLGIPLGGCGAFLGSANGQALVQGYRLGTSRYFADYPEDIRLYGLSYVTTAPWGSTLNGEISYRPNQPVQINPVDLVASGVGIPAISPPLSNGQFNQTNNATFRGYDRKEMTRAQVTMTHFLDRVMGAERLTLIGEVGIVRLGGIGGAGDVRYGRSPAFGNGALYPDNSVCTQIVNAAKPENCTNEGFVTSSSWGYRAKAVWDYTNLFPGVELNPSIAWSHDVNGYAPEPGFVEGAKAISFGLDAWFQNTYSISFSVTEFFGGDYNTQKDRDFVSMSAGVTF